ncbi:major facilitator superfamily transporter [Colletotrichum higginsianum]|nr:major facilitator superfamily transporter [Colletotrichum higginsianum]
MEPSKAKYDKEVHETTDHAAGTSYVYDGGLVDEVDEAYLRAPKSTRFYRGVLFQMILFGA